VTPARPNAPYQAFSTLATQCIVTNMTNLDANSIARELSITSEKLRKWLRDNEPHHPNDRWLFTRPEADNIKRRYRASGERRVVRATLRADRS